MILLTDEEILRTKLKDMNSTYPHLTTEAIRRKLTLHSEDNEVAKAQLKKVGEWLDEHCCTMSNGGRMLGIPPDDWQALLSEVKDVQHGPQCVSGINKEGGN